MSDIRDVREPLPCPFCGSTDVGGAGGEVHCYSCPAKITLQNTNTDYAVELWNLRQSQQAQGEDLRYRVAAAICEADDGDHNEVIWQGNPPEPFGAMIGEYLKHADAALKVICSSPAAAPEEPCSYHDRDISACETYSGQAPCDPAAPEAVPEGWRERLIADYRAQYAGQSIESWIRGLPDSLIADAPQPATAAVPDIKQIQRYSMDKDFSGIYFIPDNAGEFVYFDDVQELLLAAAPHPTPAEVPDSVKNALSVLDKSYYRQWRRYFEAGGRSPSYVCGNINTVLITEIVEWARSLATPAKSSAVPDSSRECLFAAAQPTDPDNQ